MSDVLDELRRWAMTAGEIRDAASAPAVLNTDELWVRLQDANRILHERGTA